MNLVGHAVTDCQ